MSLQARPRRRAASNDPVIVDSTEMFKSPRPEASRCVRCRHQTQCVLLGDTHSSFDTRLRGVIVRSSRANGDALRGAVGLKTRGAFAQTMQQSKLTVDAKGLDFCTGETEKIHQQLLR
eukprot:3106562-Rhodomonas_salina.2